jgi:hypothetical protein
VYFWKVLWLRLSPGHKIYRVGACGTWSAADTPEWVLHRNFPLPRTNLLKAEQLKEKIPPSGSRLAAAELAHANLLTFKRCLLLCAF